MPNLLGAMPNILNNMLASAGAAPVTPAVPGPMSSAIANPMPSGMSTLASGVSSPLARTGMPGLGFSSAAPQSGIAMPEGVYTGQDLGGSTGYHQATICAMSPLGASTFEAAAAQQYTAAVASAAAAQSAASVAYPVAGVSGGTWTTAAGSAYPAATPSYAAMAAAAAPASYTAPPQYAAYSAPAATYSTAIAGLTTLPDGVYSHAPSAASAPITYASPAGVAALSGSYGASAVPSSYGATAVPSAYAATAVPSAYGASAALGAYGASAVPSAYTVAQPVKAGSYVPAPQPQVAHSGGSQLAQPQSRVYTDATYATQEPTTTAAMPCAAGAYTASGVHASVAPPVVISHTPAAGSATVTQATSSAIGYSPHQPQGYRLY